jgi:DNA-binding transcriptional ArsR family regulator
VFIDNSKLFIDKSFIQPYMLIHNFDLIGPSMEAKEFDKTRNFDDDAEILKVLGHPVRLKIVAGLCTKECNVKHIWECLGLPQATVSQHLALLKNKGIIEGKREGVEVHYSVIHPLAKKIISILQ